jgi:hypothetical protein
LQLSEFLFPASEEIRNAFAVVKNAFQAGLPDFSWRNKPKFGANGKNYKIATKNTKWPLNIPL